MRPRQKKFQLATCQKLIDGLGSGTEPWEVRSGASPLLPLQALPLPLPLLPLQALSLKNKSGQILSNPFNVQCVA